MRPRCRAAAFLRVAFALLPMLIAGCPGAIPMSVPPRLLDIGTGGEALHHLAAGGVAKSDPPSEIEPRRIADQPSASAEYPSGATVP